jgi:hypothetical protein
MAMDCSIYAYTKTISRDKIEFNFHRQSSEPSELRRWLATSTEEVKSACSIILEKVAGLKFEEAWQ